MADEGGFYMEDDMTGRIDGLLDGVTTNARDVLEEYAQIVQDYAQFNAPWDDRTGEARQGLEASVSEELGVLYLELYHTAEHGQWLEVIQSGRFAIIMPTLELFAGEIFQAAGAAAIGGEE